MHYIKVHSVINQIIAFFHRIGFWHRGEAATAKERSIKRFYWFYYFLFVIALVAGAVDNENNDEAIFLVQIAIGVAVLLVKLWALIWKQKQILVLLNRTCVFTIRDDEAFTIYNGKLGEFMKFVIALYSTATVAVFFEAAVLPFLGSEKALFVKIGFPLNWKNDEIAFWIANIFVFTELFLSMTSFLFSITIWYIMLNCSLRYEVLGCELSKIGQHGLEGIKQKVPEKEKHLAFAGDLEKSIDAHLNLKQLISDVETFVSGIFLVQLTTSALCICGSIYSLAFNVDDFVKLFIYLFILCYYLAEIFMITYLGNEMMLSSSRLSYCLFESNWVDQPQLTKKCIIIFGEYLKQPQELLIGKVYPLTLESFTKIMKVVYNMFNILKNTKQ